MLETMWKLIRGIDRWTETKARITSVYRYTAPPRKGQSRSRVVVDFRYQTADGLEFSGSYAADSASDLYAVCEGETFWLSYDPERPEHYWTDLYGLGFGDRSVFIALWFIGMLTILILVFTSR